MRGELKSQTDDKATQRLTQPSPAASQQGDAGKIPIPESWSLSRGWSGRGVHIGTRKTSMFQQALDLGKQHRKRPPIMVSVLVDLTRWTYVDTKAWGNAGAKDLELIISYIRPGREKQSASLSEPRPVHIRHREAEVTDKHAEWTILDGLGSIGT